MKIKEILTETKQRLDAKCWKGKHKEGTKIKGGVRVNNCVPNESIEEESSSCPPATQDIELNLENRQKAIDEYGYGPLNPALPNTKFWMKKVDEWDLDSADEAKESICGNCAAFDVRQETLDCISKGIDSDNPEDAEGVVEAGDMGYCKFLKFKCASLRTCDAWVTGGPLRDNGSADEGLTEFAPSDEFSGSGMSWQDFLTLVTPTMRKWGFRVENKNPVMLYSRSGRAKDEFYMIILAPEDDMVQYSFGTVERGEPMIHEENFVSMDKRGAKLFLQKADEDYGLSDLKRGVEEATGDEKFDKSMRRMTGKPTPDVDAEKGATQEFEPIDADPSYLPMMEKLKAKLFPLAYQYWTDGNNADELRALGWEPDYGDDYVMVVLSGIDHDGYIQYDKYDFDADDEEEDDGLTELNRVLELSGLTLTADEKFDIIEEMVEHLAEEHGVDAELIWEDFESVDDNELYESAAWKRKEGKNKTGGLNAKGVASYRKENPGSKLQTAVTTKPSKLKKGSKAAKRRKSFCARMGGMKGPMKKDGKPTRKALALRKWNC